MAKQQSRTAARAVDHVCYVCHKPIGSVDKGQYLTKDTWRHHACQPGSPKWMSSEVGKNSAIRAYYEIREEIVAMEPVIDANGDVMPAAALTKKKVGFAKKDPELTPEQRQLVGRVKYMAYMTTVLKEGRIDWTFTGDKSDLTVTCIGGKVTISTPKATVLEGIAEANAPEELRCYLLGLHDEKQARAKVPAVVEPKPTKRSGDIPVTPGLVPQKAAAKTTVPASKSTTKGGDKNAKKPSVRGAGGRK